MLRTTTVLLAAVVVGLSIACQQPQGGKVDRVADCREAARRLVAELDPRAAHTHFWENNYDAVGDVCYLACEVLDQSGQTRTLHDVDRHKMLAMCARPDEKTKWLCEDYRGDSSSTSITVDQYDALRRTLLKQK